MEDKKEKKSTIEILKLKEARKNKKQEEIEKLQKQEEQYNNEIALNLKGLYDEIFEKLGIDINKFINSSRDVNEIVDKIRKRLRIENYGQSNERNES